MHAKNFVGGRHHPVTQRRFFQVGDAIQTRSDPVARDKHVARNLRLHGIHVVHQARRAGNIYQEDEAGSGYNDPTWSSTVGTASLDAGSLLPSAMFHCFIITTTPSNPRSDTPDSLCAPDDR